MAFSKEILSGLPEADIDYMAACVLNFYELYRDQDSNVVAYDYWNESVRPHFEERGYVDRYFDHLRHKGVDLARVLLGKVQALDPKDF